MCHLIKMAITNDIIGFIMEIYNPNNLGSLSALLEANYDLWDKLDLAHCYFIRVL